MKELTLEEMIETTGGYRDEMVDKGISSGGGGMLGASTIEDK